MARDLENTTTGNEKRRWSDGVNQFKFEPNEWHQVRLFGPVYSDYKHAVTTKSAKVYPEWCLGYNVDEDDFYDDREQRCPCCAVGIKGQLRFFVNLISMKKCGERPADPSSTDWNPLYFAEFPMNLIKAIKALQGLNDGYPVTNPEFGCVVAVRYNPKADATNMYQVNLGKRTPINPEWLKLSIVQDIGGKRKVLNSAKGLPALYSYDRVVNSRQDMLKSLERNGYYDQNDAKELTAASANVVDYETVEDPKTYGKSTIEELPAAKKASQPAAKIVSMDEIEEETSKKKVEPKQGKIKPDSTEETKFDPKAFVAPDCPTSFGSFADEQVCFTRCKAKKWCREASEETGVAHDDDTV
jgi:hypothetical protein